MADSDQCEVTRELQGEPSLPAEAARLKQSQRIGRYRIEKVLGQGGFGVVYLAHDEQLDRRVAVKVPHAKLTSHSEDAVAYLAEARTVANLDHPNIVPVHDVGGTDSCPCFVVSKYVEGSDLAKKLEESRPSYIEAAEWVATVAEALHHAHKQGFVHRDIKPSNILIGNDGQPYVVDFGLALREENIGKGPRYAGTPAYMSPEQARGEGHRVDGRSDIFSLGIVLYELLVGRQPFRGETQTDLLEQVASYEPRPMRQYDETLPKELERICSKALAKRASERFWSAYDMAEDLRHFLAKQVALQSDTAALGDPATQSSSHLATSVRSTPASSDSIASDSSHSQPIKIIPKGLRSFDAHDADFFLELLPGPRDREGLPDSLRFWKTRIEETDSDNTFSVGLIYGPSGCGKSSLVQAGLLPRLSDDIISVYVEATREETETRLLHGLRKYCPAVDDQLNLKESVAALRHGKGIPVGKKVLIVLDQFEQWLHAKREEGNTDLVDTLRQCQGGRVQCIVMVRDDFWMAATRFMRELDIPLVERQNSAAVDLFDVDHARRVLAAYGRAFRRLDDDRSSDQQKFLKQAVTELAEEGKVVCVRLALFAEMMKGKPWTPATLRQIGGTAGVGATFLEETFSASTAPPEHRYHQQGARDVLRALLPDSGTDIKGEMKSHEELLEASGYARRARNFDDLINMLDGEVRLITPADPEAVEADDRSVQESDAGRKFYQLTHDYLVHSLRDWLTRKQKETRRGRAELRLAERGAIWNSKPENRHLPAWWEYLNIRLLTAKKNWTTSQRQMMRKAGRVHATRWAIALMLLAFMTLAFSDYLSKQRAYVEELDRRQAMSLVDSALTVPAEGIPGAIRNLEVQRTHAIELLGELIADSTTDPKDRSRSAVVLSRFVPMQPRVMVDSIASAGRGECRYFVASLENSSNVATELLLDKMKEAEQNRDWQHKARLAVVALELGEIYPAKSMCQQLSPDPTERTVFIDTFAEWHDDLGKLRQIADTATDPSWQSAICLAAGSIRDIDQEMKSDWEPILRSWYTGAREPLLHSTAGWTLRAWKLGLPPIPATTDMSVGRHWIVTPMDLTMIRIPAGRFVRKSEAAAGDHGEIVTLHENFMISSYEVSVGLFQQFLNDPDYKGDKPSAWPGEDKSVSPSQDHPINHPHWYDAVMFCNWLSWKEGLVPRYEISVQTGEFTTQQPYLVTLVEGANGYRLPTGGEWEYVCRAGTTTRFSWGDDPDYRYCGRYCVSAENSGRRTEVVGSRFCNPWGVHDMHGNLWEWCWDWLREQDEQLPIQDPRKQIRGGGFERIASFCRSSYVGAIPPLTDTEYRGFRVARDLFDRPE